MDSTDATQPAAKHPRADVFTLGSGADPHLTDCLNDLLKQATEHIRQRENEK